MANLHKEVKAILDKIGIGFNDGVIEMKISPTQICITRVMLREGKPYTLDGESVCKYDTVRDITLQEECQ